MRDNGRAFFGLGFSSLAMTAMSLFINQLINAQLISQCEQQREAALEILGWSADARLECQI